MGGRKPWQWGMKTRWLWWNRLWCQKRESVIPPLRTQRRLPDSFTYPLNFGPSISASKGCFKLQPPLSPDCMLGNVQMPYLFHQAPAISYTQSCTPEMPIAGSRLWVTSTEVHGLPVLVNPPPTWPIPNHRQGRAQSCPPFWMTPQSWWSNSSGHTLQFSHPHT